MSLDTQNHHALSAIELLLTRQSNPFLQKPAPTKDALDIMMQAAIKVPDHAALTPWKFQIATQEGLNKLSFIFKNAAINQNSDLTKVEKCAKMPFRAPLIIIISTDYKEHPKVPKSEQLITVGCAVHAMQMAAFSLGYGAMWRTGDMSENKFVKTELGISQENDIVGFLYVGSIAKTLPAKPKKSSNEFVSYL